MSNIYSKTIFLVQSVFLNLANSSQLEIMEDVVLSFRKVLMKKNR